MTCDFKPFRQKFLAYTDPFLNGEADLDAPYRLKISHTFRVVAHSQRITRGLPNRIRFAAALAALFHDLGRFSQLKEFGTFHDGHSFNHAQRSVSELERLDLLPPQLPFKAEILEAIRFHNQKKLEKPLSSAALFFYHLLRDADKTDILAILKSHYQAGIIQENQLTLGLLHEESVSIAVLNALQAGHNVDLKDVRTVHDFKLLQIGWIFDIFFSETYRFVIARRDFQEILATISSELLPSSFLARFPQMLQAELGKKHDIQSVAREAGWCGEELYQELS